MWQIQIYGESKCVFVGNYQCVHMFLAKTEAYNVTVLTYVYMLVSTYARVTKVSKSGVCVWMCVAILTSMEIPAHGSLANIPISL